eukprot:gene16699-11953_t
MAEVLPRDRHQLSAQHRPVARLMSATISVLGLLYAATPEICAIGPVALPTSLEPETNPWGGDSWVPSTWGPTKADWEAACVYQTRRQEMLEWAIEADAASPVAAAFATEVSNLTMLECGNWKFQKEDGV